jgi:uncharacterized protein (TIGR03382 family)
MRKTVYAFGIASILFAATSAEAAGLNDPSCKPTPARPNPVVFVHGQGGNFEGANALTGSLVSAGYCVYAKNYGKPPGGNFGQEHLSTSAAEIGAFIDDIMAKTKASKVDVVGHSAGTGVLDNYIQKRGGAAKVQHSISFGGLHHPYAHGGLPNVVDASIYLPNLIAAARLIVPGITMKEVATTAVSVFGVNDPAMVQTATSNFVNDLFEPDYWQDLQGAHSEAPGNFVMVGMSGRSRPTKDAAPNVCYTNIVAIADLLVGPATGFQDAADNVDNFLLESSVTQNAHNDMLADPAALQKMQAGLTWACKPGPANKQLLLGNENGVGTVGDRAAQDAFESAIAERRDDADRDDPRPELGTSGGCSSSSRAPTVPAGIAAAVVGLALAFVWRRRVSDRAPSLW